MKLVILHSPVAADAGPDEQDTLVQVQAVAAALRERGHSATPLPCALDLARVATELRALAPDLVFNLVEAVDGTSRLIHLGLSLLEHLRLPFCGAGADAMYLTTNKLTAKTLLRQSGLPTAAWVTAEDLRAGRPLPPGALIIKSLWEHASFGLNDDAVVTPRSREELLDILERRRDRLGGSCFAEQFIPGREFNLSLLDQRDGVQVLPVAEMTFPGDWGERPKMVGFAAKWEGSSFEYEHTVRSFALAVDDAALADHLAFLARQCFALFALRGWARVDFRVDATGRPFILEVNANPCLSPDAGFAAAAAQVGINYVSLVETIVSTAQSPVAARRPATDHAAGTAGLTFRRGITRSDRDAIGRIVRDTGFFSDAEVGIAVELADAALARGEAEAGYFFVVADLDGEVVGYSCFGPIPATVSSFDLYWIAVDKRFQHRGFGREILRESERAIAARGGRNIYVETAGRPQYAPTRAFYEATDYATAARFADFYSDGDDKVVYVKRVG
jgi:D-alanine-D-alanine ligase-like ATP-grasp enzyme/ribosomal protein S18 acetylase RimI-like enzyme